MSSVGASMIATVMFTHRKRSGWQLEGKHGAFDRNWREQVTSGKDSFPMDYLKRNGLTSR